MDFYFTDRKFNLLGIASTSSDAPISIFNDQDILSISAASRTFEGTLIFSAKERDQVKSMANYGNYILYKDENGQSIFMTIMEIEHDPKEGEHFIRAEDAGMDLINGLVDAYSATKAMTFAEYFKLFAGDTGFEIGINEISNLSRTLKWESESQTILARLLSLATQFDNAELSFSFEITGTQVVKRFVDVHKKRGADKRITLYMDKDINNIVTKANIYDLCTAIVATGGTPEGKNEPINLKGYNYKDPNGRFVLNKTTGVMQDMESVKIWSRLLSNNNPNPNAGHIQRVKTYETTDQKTLCDNVIRELEKASQPAINYETDIANLPDNVKIGDTIYLVDENEKLFLSARVLELTRCYSTNEHKATLGDYLIQDGGVSQSLKELADQLKQATTYVWIRYADDEEGNGISALPAGKTYIAIKQVLGVPTASDDPADYRGLWVKFVGEGVPGPPGENGQPTYTWLKYADDYQGTNMTDDPTGKYYIGLATNKLTATESNDPKDYKWQLVKGEDGKDGEQGPQGVPGPKGDNGQTYYTWLKYADTPTSGMSDSPTGKTYIGLAYNKASATESTNYADYTWSLIKGSDGAQGPKGDNGQTLYTWIKYATSATGAGMSDSPTGKTYIGLAYNKTTAIESTNAADYTWSLIKGDKGDTGATGPQGPQGPTGPKGDRGIMGVAYMQPTQPSDTTEGATWFQTESSTSDKIIAVYTYKSGWQKKKYASATLAVESLDALSADLGKITAGIINGVEIQGEGLYSDYDYQIAEGSTVWRKGRLSMSGGYFRNDFQTYVKSTGEIQNNGFSQFSHEDLQFVVFNGSQKTKADRYLSINPYRFTMTDSRGLGGNLTFQDLYNIGKTGIPAASGWSQYSTSPSSGNFPSATRLGRMVQVSGAFKNNSTLPNTNNTYVVGVLPVGFRPQMQVKYLGKGAGTTIFMVTIDTNGEISISYRLGWTGSSFGYLTNNANDIFNIAGVFSAADV